MFPLYIWQDVLPDGRDRQIIADAEFVRDIGWYNPTTGAYVYEEQGADSVKFKRVQQWSLNQDVKDRLSTAIRTEAEKLLGSSIQFRQELLLMKYGPGDTFGWHSDSHSMQNGRWLPTPGRQGYDWSVVIYVGVECTGGILEFRNGVQITPRAGHMVMFPCGFSHQVQPVTGGERWAITTFLQSRF